MLGLDQASRVIVHSEDHFEALIFSEDLTLVEEHPLHLLLPEYCSMPGLELLLHELAV